MGKGKIRGGISRNASSESFLLLQPIADKSSDEVAKAIAAYKGVKRVYLTTGKYGFMVAVNNDKDRDIVAKQLRKLTKSDIPHLIEAHFSYRI